MVRASQPGDREEKEMKTLQTAGQGPVPTRQAQALARRAEGATGLACNETASLTAAHSGQCCPAGPSLTRPACRLLDRSDTPVRRQGKSLSGPAGRPSSRSWFYPLCRGSTCLSSFHPTPEASRLLSPASLVSRRRTSRNPLQRLLVIAVRGARWKAAVLRGARPARWDATSRRLSTVWLK